MNLNKFKKSNCPPIVAYAIFHNFRIYLSATYCFRTGFKKAREVYSKLGQHAYSHQFDSKRPLQIKRGTTKLGNKYIYFGQLEERTNKRDGVGISVYSDGRIYEGCWKNDNLNGFGRYIYKNGDFYIGEFFDGYIHGQGTYCWSNGRKYVGEWEHDDKEGKGIQYTTDGQICREGVWENDKYVGKE